MNIQVKNISEVKPYKDSFEIKQDDGWYLCLDKKWGVIPQAGQQIKILSHWGNEIHGIEIDGKVAFWLTKEQAESKHEKWKRKVRKENKQKYQKLMKQIQKEDIFVTVDISGMGGGYERACQKMLRAGIEYLSNKPNFVFDYKEYKYIYGICFSESEHAKALDKALTDAVNGDCSGAMHQAVISHLRYIHKHGYEKWLNECGKDRQYSYPRELPAPTF